MIQNRRYQINYVDVKEVEKDLHTIQMVQEIMYACIQDKVYLKVITKVVHSRTQNSIVTLQEQEV
jgi:hypothetical protein